MEKYEQSKKKIDRLIEKLLTTQDSEDKAQIQIKIDECYAHYSEMERLSQK